MYRSFLLCFSVFLLCTCGRAPNRVLTNDAQHEARSDQEHIETFLMNKGISFSGPDRLPQGVRYELKISQPLDHNNPDGERFEQRVFLTHHDFRRNTVIITEGYAIGRPKTHELTDFLMANQVQVEHRFFGKSRPEVNGMGHLNLGQATADYHRIRTLLAGLYSQDWVSTGVSKGGATTLFYRYLFPDDVAASVAYVAPINRAYEDQRLYDFLDTIGTDACRQNIIELQRRLLRDQDDFLPKLAAAAAISGETYDQLGLRTAFEYGVMELSFAFWQGGGDCSKIPDKQATSEKVLNYFTEMSGTALFSDELIAYYSPHYYQAATEMGYYGYRTALFHDLLRTLPTDRRPMALFFTQPVQAPFDVTLLNGINKWLATDAAERIIYINGANDTWSATGVPERAGVDSEWFVLKGRAHGDARIKNFSPGERARLRKAMKRWLGVKIK